MATNNIPQYSNRGFAKRQPSGNLTLTKNISRLVNYLINGLKNIQTDANKKK